MEDFEEWWTNEARETHKAASEYDLTHAAWQAATERAAGIAETTAEDIRKANTYRGKVNQMAGEAAGWIDRLAAAIRKG